MDVTITHIVRFENSAALETELRAKLEKIAFDTNVGFADLRNLIMTTAVEFQAAFDKVGVATTAIAARIQALLNQPLSGMTAAEETALKTQFDVLVDSLEAMAVTPANPVPVPVPDPVPTNP